MSRRPALVAVALLLVLGHADAAVAQAPIVNPINIIGGGGDDSDSHDANTDSDCAVAVPILCAGGAVIGGVAGAAGDVAASGAQAVGGTVMSGLASWAGDGAAWLIRQMGRQIDKSSRPSLDSEWFTDRYGTLRDLGIALSALFLVLAVINAVARQDVGRLLRAVVVALPVSMLLTFAAIALTRTGLELTDWMTARVLGDLDDDAGRAFADLSKLLLPAAATGNPMPGFVVFLVASGTALLGLLVWLELVLREAAIYVAVAFLPLTFAAMVWERTAHWCRRLTEWLAALILAKFTIACAFAVAVAALGNARGAGGGVTALLAGCAVLLVAAVTPWALLQLIPMGTDAVLRRDHVRSATRATPGVGTATVLARDVMMVRFRGAVGAGGAARATAAKVQLPGRTSTPGSRPTPPSSRSFARQREQQPTGGRRDDD